jgi:hypothetical protein
MNQNLKRVVYLLTVSLVFFAHNAKSAELNFVSGSSQINALQPVQIDLVLNSGQEKFNAVSGEVVFSDESVSLLAIEDGRSVVNFWIDKPTASQGNRIVFSGITPGGYQGNGAQLFSLIFMPKKAGSFTLRIDQPRVLLHDGVGTPAKVEAHVAQFNIVGSIGSSEKQYSVTDTVSPQEFSVEVSKNQFIAEGRWFAVFATQDKETGIAFYQAQEQKENQIDQLAWRTVESPYVLQDQSLSSYIFIKAVDQKGNEFISTKIPQHDFWYKKPKYYGIIISIIFIIIVFHAMKYLWRKKIKK